MSIVVYSVLTSGMTMVLGELASFCMVEGSVVAMVRANSAVGVAGSSLSYSHCCIDNGCE